MGHVSRAEVAATLRAFVAASGATHVVAATPAGTFGCDAAATVTFQREEADEPAVLEPGDALPARLEVAPRRLEPFEAVEVIDDVADPRGDLEHAAQAALSLARATGPDSTVVVWLATTDELELAISAGEADGIVVVLGDEQLPLREGGRPPWRPAP